MNKSAAILTGLAGAGITSAAIYFGAPDQGHKRRKMARERMSAAWKSTSETVGERSRDIADRAREMAESARSTVRQFRRSDARMAERVRSRIERAVSHPDAVEVSAEDGTVRLSGAVLAEDVSGLISEVSGLRGVYRVENRLTIHRSAEGVPELQGLGRKKGEWPGPLRTMAGLTGGALTVYGIRRRNDVLGRVASIVGTGLLARRIGNRTLRRVIRMAAA